VENKLEFRYIRSFLAIAEELHFGRAAARLHLAQPSLSQQLQRLERQVGAELVTRSSREVKLTAAGRAFETEARRLLEHADRAVVVTREVAAGRSGSISIGFNFDAGQRILAPTLRRLNVEFPHLSTTLWEARSGVLIAALNEGRIDVALSFASQAMEPLRSHRLLTVPLALLLGEQHRWANRSQVPFRDLARDRVLLFRRECSPAMYDTILATADRCDISLPVSGYVDDSGATAMIVATRPVVAFASSTRARVPTKGLIAAQLVDPEPMIGIYAVWRPDPAPVVAMFLRCLEAAGPFSESLSA
jgi:DNA-binding transcriptional LysR family regulator